MSLDTMHSEWLTVVSQPLTGEDEYQDPAPGPAQRRRYRGAIWQTDAFEVIVGATTEVSTWAFSIDPAAVIGGSDQVRDENGRTFRVLQPPALQTSRATRRDHHTEGRLQLIEEG